MLRQPAIRRLTDSTVGRSWPVIMEFFDSHNLWAEPNQLDPLDWEGVASA